MRYEFTRAVSKPGLSLPASYGLAVLLVASAFLLRLALMPALGGGTPAAIVVIPTLLATRFGGLGPGILAAALSAMSSEYWLVMGRTHERVWSVAGALHTAVFVIEGAAAITLTAPVRAARMRAEAVMRRLRDIYRLSASLGEATTMEEVAHATLRDGLTALGSDGGAIFLASPEPGGPLRLMSHMESEARIEDMVQPIDEPIPLDSDLPPAVAARQRTIVATSDAQDTIRQFPTLRDVIGRRVPPAFICAPLLVDGRLIGVIATAWARTRPGDGEDRRWVESIARDSAMALDRAQLLEREREARIAAQAASRAKDTFLVTVSDALHEPLPSILAGARELQDRAADQERLSGALDAIERGLLTETRLVDSLLDLAHLASHEFRMGQKPVDLSRLVRICVDDQREAARGRGVRLITSRLDAAMVAGDVEPLRHAVCDLVANAIQFTPRGGQVRVQLEAHDGTGIVRVRDGGTGIPTEDLERVFEAFRLGSDLGGGSRLGIHMAIAKHVADHHHGAIHCDREGEKAGTTVSLELPLAQST
jgi:K+-sensing histidine kinase KdpD